jgi:hypothetical protein
VWPGGVGQGEVSILSGLYDLGDDVALDVLEGEAGISDKLIDLANALSQLGVVAILDLVIRPGWDGRYLPSRWAI